MHVICTYMNHFALPKTERTQRDIVICCWEKKTKKEVPHSFGLCVCGSKFATRAPCCVYVCSHQSWIANSLHSMETRQLYLVRTTHRSTEAFPHRHSTSDHHPFGGRRCMTARPSSNPLPRPSFPTHPILPPTNNTPFICTYRIVVIESSCAHGRIRLSGWCDSVRDPNSRISGRVSEWPTFISVTICHTLTFSIIFVIVKCNCPMHVRPNSIGFLFFYFKQ